MSQKKQHQAYQTAGSSVFMHKLLVGIMLPFLCNAYQPPCEQMLLCYAHSSSSSSHQSKTKIYMLALSVALMLPQCVRQAGMIQQPHLLSLSRLKECLLML